MSSIKEGIIFGLGNPLLDILANVDESFLAKHGLKANNAILAEPSHQKLGEEMESSFPVKFIAGGSCQNTMRVAQWALRKWPKACTMMGCIGDDSFGKRMASKASEDNVRTLYLIDGSLPTGHCCVLVSNGGKCRSLVANLCAANEFKKEFLLQNWAAVEQANVLYITGFHLTVCPQAMVEVAEHVQKTSGKLLAFNLSAPFIMQFFSAQLNEIMPYVDIVFCNDSELAEYAKLREWSTEGEKENWVPIVAKRLANEPRRTAGRHRVVVITQDCEPVLLLRSDSLLSGESESPILITPIDRLKEEEIVDTNGAGDAFAGGFLAELVLNQSSLKLDSLRQCIASGNKAAREIIQVDGCTIPEKDF